MNKPKLGRDSNDPLDWTFKTGPMKGKHLITVDADTQCWIWQGYKCAGYGVTSYPADDKRFRRIRIGRKRRKQGHTRIMAHQLFYYLKYGNPPINTELGHTCNRRSCCSPDHVRAIPASQNIAEMYRMPSLSLVTKEAIVDAILDDQPLRQIADYYCISVWSVRQLAKEVDMRDQLVFTSANDIPF